MEYMKIEGFLGGAVSKLINTGLESKLGFKPNLELKNLNFSTNDEETYVKVQLTAFMSREAFDKMLEEVTK